jgi:ElaB/YqjD/DUF883 family membrane-anchored ribosome-binding protein
MSADLNGSKKIQEALQLLNDAAKEKKEEIQNLLGDKYDDVKKIFQDSTHEGTEKIKEAVSDAEKTVKENPWQAIAVAATAALVLGILIGSSKKKE